MTTNLEKGVVIGHYRVQMPIGSGTFGCIYRVFDITDRKWKALKVVKKTKEINQNYIGERRMLEELRGTRGVPILHDFYEDDTLEYLVLPLYIGDLENMRLKPFKPKTTMKIGIEILKILRDIHGKGFIHRDLKSANVMVSFDQKREKLILIDYNVGIRFGVRKNPRTLSLRRLPIPLNDFNFEKCIYSAMRAGDGSGSQETEDLEQLAYLLMDIREIFPFWGPPEEFARQKVEFRKDPMQFLTQGNLFLYPVIQVLLKQEYGAKPDYKKVLKVMRTNGYSIHESAPFDIRTSPTGKPYLE